MIQTDSMWSNFGIVADNISFVYIHIDYQTIPKDNHIMTEQTEVSPRVHDRECNKMEIDSTEDNIQGISWC